MYLVGNLLNIPGKIEAESEDFVIKTSVAVAVDAVEEYVVEIGLKAGVASVVNANIDIVDEGAVEPWMDNKAVVGVELEGETDVETMAVALVVIRLVGDSNGEEASALFVEILLDFKAVVGVEVEEETDVETMVVASVAEELVGDPNGEESNPSFVEKKKKKINLWVFRKSNTLYWYFHWSIRRNCTLYQN